MLIFDEPNGSTAAYRYGGLTLFLPPPSSWRHSDLEHLGGYAPCPLCLMQRYAYYAAIPPCSSPWRSSQRCPASPASSSLPWLWPSSPIPALASTTPASNGSSGQVPQHVARRKHSRPIRLIFERA